MSDQQDSYDPYENAGTEDTIESESGETDFEESLPEGLYEMATTAFTSHAEMPITTFECVQCNVPEANVSFFTCKSGHLICSKCVQLPTGTNLKSLPRCPHCDEDADSNSSAAIQFEVLFSKCRFCQKEFRNYYLCEHENFVCEMRPVCCKYEMGGCDWHGIAAEQHDHETQCPVQHKSGAEIFEVLEKKWELEEEELKSTKKLVAILSQSNCDLINIRLMKQSPPADADFRCYYESEVFSASSMLFFIKAKVVERTGQAAILEFMIKKCTSLATDQSCVVLYAALGGPLQIKPSLLEHNFNAHSTESAYMRLYEFDEGLEHFDSTITFRLMLAIK